MKKFLCMLLIFVLGAVMIVPVTISAATADKASAGADSGFTWTLSDDGTLTISGNGAIPDYENAFKDDAVGRPWFLTRESITKVIIEDGITGIGDGAFFECTSLKSVTIPKSVTYIGGTAFVYCSQLESVYIEDMAAWCSIDFPQTGILSIPNGTPLFYGGKLYLNGNLVEDLVIPQGVTEINDNVFYGYTSLKSVVIPESVTQIGEYAFYGCSNLTKINISSGLTSIEYQAFHGCDMLSEVNINSLASWCNIDFEYHRSFPPDFDDRDRDLSSNPLYNPEAVLYLNHSPLTDIVIPEGVTEIKALAFYNCSTLKSVTIPDSVTNIEEIAFCKCNNLKSVTIPASVKSIGTRALGFAEWLGSSERVDGFTIYGYTGTEAERYANDKDFTFVDLDKPTAVIGDADGDGEVTSIDVTFVQRYCARVDVNIDDDTLMNADVDGNSLLEIIDATYIQRHLAKIDTPYMIGEAY